MCQHNRGTIHEDVPAYLEQEPILHFVFQCYLLQIKSTLVHIAVVQQETDVRVLF
jgi:hypothetical protein